MKVLLGNRAFLEAPRWHDGRLWLSDMAAGEVLSAEANGTVRVEAEVPARPSGLGWLPDGRLLVVSMGDRKVLRREGTGELVVHADLSAQTEWPLNDMVVDDAGFAYIGGFGFDFFTGSTPIEGSSLYRADPDGGVTIWGEDLRCPNGMAITADGRRLIVAETFGARLTSFDIVGRDLHNQRPWADFGAPDAKDLAEYTRSRPVTPDGICLGAAGCAWVADPLGLRAIRVRPGGEILDEVRHRIPIFACALGGDDGNNLFLCAAPGPPDDRRRASEVLVVRR